MELGPLQKKAFMTKVERDRTLYSCYPHPYFPTLSITGNSCALQCKHCSGRYLRGMIPCTTPDELRRTCLGLASNGARGVLLSGGYNGEGYVLFEPFLEAIKQVKRETGMFISAHTGLAPEWFAQELGRVGIDLADFDLIGDDETIKLVLGIEKTVEDYRRAMKTLKQFLPYVVPHICIGLHAGEVRGEFKALEMASEIEPAVIVLLVLTPTTGTEFENLPSPHVENIKRVMVEARLMFPKAELALGCMRPRDSSRIEIELAALLAGVDRIELPSEQTLRAAQAMGLVTKKLCACCAVPNETRDKWSL